MRIRDGRVEKRLDMFLVYESIMKKHDGLGSWLEVGGESDRLLIILQIEKEGGKPPSPFKFNLSHLENEDFVQLVSS
jgi:hypothetical protein